MSVEEEDVRLAGELDFEVFLALLGQTREHAYCDALHLLQSVLGTIRFDEMDAKIDFFPEYFLKSACAGWTDQRWPKVPCFLLVDSRDPSPQSSLG